MGTSIKTSVAGDDVEPTEKGKKPLVFRTWREADAVARDSVTWTRR